MSAMEAIRARGVAELVAFLNAERERRGWSVAHFARTAFGVNEKGAPKNQSYLTNILKGAAQNRPNLNTLTQLAKALEVPVDKLIALRDGAGPPAVAMVVPPAPPRRRDEQFALTIDTEGRATLRIHLQDVPMAQAFRAMAALTSAGILPTGAEAEPS
jgi:transcriptional regulator with XRE-family HTH domain